MPRARMGRNIYFHARTQIRRKQRTISTTYASNIYLLDV